MAFTTQEGTGGAPWTFQGTPAADSIAVITGNTGNSVAFDFIAEGFEGDDTINFNGTRSVTIKGGQGDDLVTNNIAASAGLTSIITTSFINGNDGNDTIGNRELGLLATLSTISGGQGNDRVYLRSLQSSKVNGNLGDDFLDVGNVQEDVAPELRSEANFNSASIFGGQGGDAIRVRTTQSFSNSLVAGQLGNDFIQIQLGTFNFAQATATPFDPSNGVTGVAGDSSSTFSGGDGDDVIDASGLLLDISSGGTVEIDSRGRGAASGADLFLVGDDGDDSVFGGVGEDTLEGGANDDWLAGGGNRDEVFGGTGDDVVIGAYFDGELSVGIIGDGAGDFLSGGTGSNRFFVPGARAPRAISGGAGFTSNPIGSTGEISVFKASTAGATLATAVIADGDLITVNFGADVITDWTSGAGTNVLDTGLGNTLELGAAPAAQMSFGETYNQTNNFAVRGFYTERFNEVGQFVVNQNGSDIAVWTNYTGAQFTQGTALTAGGSLSSSVNNFTILRGVGTSVVLTANQFVAV